MLDTILLDSPKRGIEVLGKDFIKQKRDERFDNIINQIIENPIGDIDDFTQHMDLSQLIQQKIIKLLSDFKNDEFNEIYNYNDYFLKIRHYMGEHSSHMDNIFKLWGIEPSTKVPRYIKLNGSQYFNYLRYLNENIYFGQCAIWWGLEGLNFKYRNELCKLKTDQEKNAYILDIMHKDNKESKIVPDNTYGFYNSTYTYLSNAYDCVLYSNLVESQEDWAHTYDGDNSAIIEFDRKDNIMEIVIPPVRFSENRKFRDNKYFLMYYLGRNIEGRNLNTNYFNNSIYLQGLKAELEEYYEYKKDNEASEVSYFYHMDEQLYRDIVKIGAVNFENGFSRFGSNYVTKNLYSMLLNMCSSEYSEKGTKNSKRIRSFINKYYKFFQFNLGRLDIFIKRWKEELVSMTNGFKLSYYIDWDINSFRNLGHFNEDERHGNRISCFRNGGTHSNSPIYLYYGFPSFVVKIFQVHEDNTLENFARAICVLFKGHIAVTNIYFSDREYSFGQDLMKYALQNALTKDLKLKIPEASLNHKLFVSLQSLKNWIFFNDDMEFYEVVPLKEENIFKDIRWEEFQQCICCNTPAVFGVFCHEHYYNRKYKNYSIESCNECGYENLYSEMERTPIRSRCREDDEGYIIDEEYFCFNCINN